LKKLAVLILLISALLTACATEPSGAAADTATGETAAAQTELSNSDVIRSRHTDTGYEGYVFRILTPKPGAHFYWLTGENENEIYYEAQTGDVLNDAIYMRNIQTEELLDIKLEPLWADSTDAVSATLKKSVMAADNEFDVLLNRLDFQMNSSTENLLYNILDIEAIDVAEPWWDKNIVSGFTMFNTKLYAIAGDINYYDDYAVLAMYYNKSLCEDLGFDQLYGAVADGKWTFDLFAGMTKASSADLDGDGTYNIDNDLFGYVNHEHSILHLIYALGEKMSAVDSDGIIRINRSENLVDVVNYLYDFHKDNQAVHLKGEYINAFKNGRALFFAEVVGGLPNFRDMEDDFGVLPMPKRTEEQTDHLAYVSNGWTTAMAVPLTSADPERAGTVLEVMSAFSSDTVTAALYDVLLETKLIRDEDSQVMLSVVFASKVYDWAGDLSWANDLRAIYGGLLSASSNNFVSTMESRIKGIQARLDAFIASYAETDG
jgi:ABC-type glycerol-3-phosphate transport system substrate-binding protein